ncbi:hypothetical protein [Secundilactobacillus odoratitofui]|uniref:hypothetical protein n=1 Tax=Secundilactobacillus odoratitofui TaxID=480930 RepID=UPI0020926DF7|nr:hypothetical protein [Secundilactobacillus odoratitofui]
MASKKAPYHLVRRCYVGETSESSAASAESSLVRHDREKCHLFGNDADQLSSDAPATHVHGKRMYHFCGTNQSSCLNELNHRHLT